MPQQSALAVFVLLVAGAALLLTLFGLGSPLALFGV